MKIIFAKSNNRNPWALFAFKIIAYILSLPRTSPLTKKVGVADNPTPHGTHPEDAMCFFTITAEILARSLANFYRQYADRHMNMKFVRRVSERERAIRPFVIVNSVF